MRLVSILKEGLYFDCEKCGKCCSSSAEGFIYMFKSDIERLATYFKISLEDFADKYLEIVNYTFRIWNENLEHSFHKRLMPTLKLRTKEGQDCMFLMEQNGKKLCSIYGYHPDQCASFPKWTTVMENETALKESADSCPGFILYPDESVIEQYRLQNIQYFSPEELKEGTRKERQIEREYYLAMKSNNFDIFKVYPFLRQKDSI